MEQVLNPIAREELTSELTSKEKVLIMRQTFLQEKTEANTVKNTANYLAENFSKIDGFDKRWSSLITNNPLLFEDIDYFRCKQYINNTITPEEIEAFKRGKLREIYSTFENMLMCNLAYYDRIMAFCTMAFLHYVRLSSEEITAEHLEKVPYVFEMTPTQIWCAAMTSTKSTEWELNYAWSINNRKLPLINVEGKSLIEANWSILYKNQTFAKFNEYSALRCGTSGFRQTFTSDRTNNRKLSQICTKFTKTSTAISEDQLQTIYEYSEEQESLNRKLYTALHKCMLMMFAGDESQFAIYVYSKEFYIHSAKFSMKVSKSDNGKITKDYLANSYECFAAEEFLFPSIKTQIEWAKYILPIQYEYDKQMLKSLLNRMLQENFRNILCIKRMNECGVLSKIYFSGIFNNVYIHEELMFNNRCIRSTKVCFSKQKAAQYVIDKGYYVFGIEKDVHNMGEITKKSLIEHYSNYCIPVLSYMNDVILLHQLNKNDIIDVVCSGILNPSKINNKNIKYSTLKSDINPRQIMNSMFSKQTDNLRFAKKSYWKVVDS